MRRALLHAMQAAFEKYDKDGTGYLDSREWAAVCSEMGFGSVSHQIFRSLDHDGSGAVTYRELVDSLHDEVPEDLEAKRLITTLVMTWDKAVDEESKQFRKRRMDTKDWKINGKDAKSIREELRQLLVNSGAHIIDIVQERVLHINPTCRPRVSDFQSFPSSRLLPRRCLIQMARAAPCSSMMSNL